MYGIEIFHEVTRILLQIPIYHVILDCILLSLVIWLVVSARKSRKAIRIAKLTKEEEEQLLAEWTPEPLVQPIDPLHHALNTPVVDGKMGRYISINDTQCLNMATFNFLGFGFGEDFENDAIECIKQYGVGSCGPRGFYGTAEVHLHLEERLAAAFGCEQAVLYSYGFSAISSAIPAYAKKGDIIFVDECVNFAIQKGLDASRSKIKYFRHNDCEHLLSLLESQGDEDAMNPRLAKVSRRFLVVEGIYINKGTLCVNLKRMIELKKRFKLRLFIDESISFGTLGKTGLGITEHFDVDRSDVDLIMASLEFSMGSVGGFCVGTSFVVEHQTLAGLAYCFSASLPPMLAKVVITALDKLQANPDLVTDLRNKSETISRHFSDIPGLKLFGEPISPVKHLSLSNHESMPVEQQESILREIVTEARVKGLALCVACYLRDREVKCPIPSIRLTTISLLKEEDFVEAASILSEVCDRHKLQ